METEDRITEVANDYIRNDRETDPNGNQTV